MIFILIDLLTLLGEVVRADRGQVKAAVHRDVLPQAAAGPRARQTDHAGGTEAAVIVSASGTSE